MVLTQSEIEVAVYGKTFIKTTHDDTYPFIDPMKSNMNGKHVFITGVSRGIGKAIALSYAKSGASDIVISARSNLQPFISELHSAATNAGRPKPNILALELDVTSKESVQAAASEIRSKLSYVDIVVHNAGVLEARMPIAESDPDTWLNTHQTNVIGSYLVLRAMIPLLLASPNPDKTIVGLTSIAAFIVNAGASAYQTSKLVLLRLMENINAEYGEKGICAYGMHPGGVLTGMADKAPQYLREMLRDSVELPADTITWLTRERRDWLAGRYISCNWDMEELVSKKKEIESENLLKIRLAI